MRSRTTLPRIPRVSKKGNVVYARRGSTPPAAAERGKNRERGITRGEGALSAGARVESRAGRRRRRRPPAGRRLRTCIPRGAQASGGPACACARCRSAAGERGGQAGAGAEFLQSLTWLPFRCCSRARRRWARQAAAARRRGRAATARSQ